MRRESPRVDAVFIEAVTKESYLLLHEITLVSAKRQSFLFAYGENFVQVSQMIFIVLACHVDIVQVIYITWHMSKNTLHGALKDPRVQRRYQNKGDGM